MKCDRCRKTSQQFIIWVNVLGVTRESHFCCSHAKPFQSAFRMRDSGEKRELMADIEAADIIKIERDQQWLV